MKRGAWSKMHTSEILNSDAAPFSLRRDFFFMCVLTAIEQDSFLAVARSKGMRRSKSCFAEIGRAHV